MHRLFTTVVLGALAIAASMLSAEAATVSCPLFQATRTIVDSLPPGWSTNSTVSPVTNWRVDTSSGQPILVCEYGASGAVQQPAPVNQNCTKAPGRKFQCIAAPPPGPAIAVVSDGTVAIADNGAADFDAGGQPDMQLNASNPFLRLIVPVNGAKFSPQGTHMPSPNECVSAPYSGAPVQQVQLPVGSWMCIATSDGNFGRVRVAVVNGIPGFPVPMTIYFDHTTWSASNGGGGNQQVHSTATLQIQQTFEVDLDQGVVAGDPAADLWFQASGPGQLSLKPVNGSQLAVGNKSDRGYAGCSAEAFSPGTVSLNLLSVNDFICYATSDGRVGEFRINGLSNGFPKKLSITFTTWE